MSRREARTLAMKSLFSLDFTTDVSPLDTVKALLEDEDTPALPKDDENYAAALVTGLASILRPLTVSLIPFQMNGKSSAWPELTEICSAWLLLKCISVLKRLLLPLPSVRRWRLPKSMAEMTLPISSMASWGH